MKLSLRTTQLLVCTLVLAVVLVVALLAGFSFILESVVEEARLRVQMDLNSAWSAYNEETTVLQMAVAIASQHEELRNALGRRTDTDTVARQLSELREKYQLDYLTLIDNQGVVQAGSPRSQAAGRNARPDPVIQRALDGEASNGTVLISRRDLLLKSDELADRAYIPLVITERAIPTDELVEDRGMVLEAAVPILSRDGAVLGAVYGGIMLNRWYGLVDRIRNAVYGDEVYDGKPLGTVTIFLWDVRVATNVIKTDSTRAIGTRVSDEVYATVLEKGRRFWDRAFVVNDWYLSAYDPISDPDGNTIGILYVGLLEKKYLAYRSGLATRFGGISLLSLVLAAWLAVYLSGKLRRPVMRLVEATRKLSAGELSTRVDTTEGALQITEVTELGRSFNSMAESLETNSRQLHKASSALEKALAEADEKNRAYLEMLGFVTHELKSPLASIVFTIGSLRDRILGPLTDKQESILKSASNSADYLNFTIANYLNLGRIEEGALRLKTRVVSLREEVIDPVIQRLSETAIDAEMEVTCDVPSTAKATGDPNLLTSVFQNLLSNAVKYGRKGGRIELTLEEADATAEGFLRFAVFNEGAGFSEVEALGLFGKFSRFRADEFGTKSGTGLGLFVTKSIIEKHGGKIWAESEAGKWAKFVFTIPTNIPPEESADDSQSQPY